jgi:hypothetical protein
MRMNLDIVQETGASDHQVAYAVYNSNALDDQKASIRAVTKAIPKNIWVDHLKRIQTTKTSRPSRNSSDILRRG